MGIMIIYHEHDNPVSNAHKNKGAHYTWQNTVVTLSIFSYVYWPSVCPLGQSVYLGPLLIFNWIVWFFGVEFYKFFINFGY